MMPPTVVVLVAAVALVMTPNDDILRRNDAMGTLDGVRDCESSGVVASLLGREK